MFRYVLFLTFTAGLASAATMTAQATCDGVTTVGTFGASCNDGRYMAFAGIDAPSFVDTRIGVSPNFSVSVDVNQVGGLPGSGVATASFSDDYVFTIYGGTGNGSFCPVIDTFHGSGAFASMSFAGLTIVDCPIPSQHKPFTFGVPQIVSIDMSGQASGVGALSGGARASFEASPILFFDPAGNPLSNVTYTLVSVDLPEPSAWSLLAVGAMFFLAVAMIERVAGTEE
jgi:hypothetical protein